jgi:hypothetical protein
MYGSVPDILISLLRWVLTIAGTWVVAKGWISADESNMLMGTVVTLISQLFSVYFHMASNGSIPVKSTSPNAANGVPIAKEGPQLSNVTNLAVS